MQKYETEDILAAIQMKWSRRRTLVAGGVALCALGVAGFVLSNGDDPASTGLIAKARDVRVRALPAHPADLEKHGYQSATVLGPDAARQRNEAVPFELLSGIAKPFIFQGSEADRSAALRCLAAAVVYEAGDDPVGGASVAQVVLNRVRHAAFPSTVCGVVYQGSERQTGCQFTFTCDGSLGRQIPDAAWGRARRVAQQALSGYVDTKVGLATHYHTDWVYPYWSPELKKYARVGTHLFFGWPGYWGGPKAFRQEYKGNEQEPNKGPVKEVLEETVSASTVDMGGAKILGLPQAPAKLPAEMGNVPLYGTKLRLVGSDRQSFGLYVPQGVKAASMVNAALALCKNDGPCRVNAWAHEDDVPGNYPISAGSRAMMIFEYTRSGSGGGQTLFDCMRFPNKDPKVCLASTGEVSDVLKGLSWKED